MPTNTPIIQKGTKTPRPPVVAIMGHIDHGKSSLLDYIRKTNVVAKEAGGITQHLGAYEVVHAQKEGGARTITFLDTPGHEAFKGIRSRGANVADIAILIVSGEEGVKPQTIEALGSIKHANIPYVVAITKIDKPQADVERTKQSMAENEIYVEGYGGDIPCVPISSKTGDGISDLLDMLLLVADVSGITANLSAPPTGYVIESSVSKRDGISATIIVRDGILKKGSFVVAEGAIGSTRRLEDFKGSPITEATAGTPARIVGWDTMPRIGATFSIAESKRGAEERVSEFKEKAVAKKQTGGPVPESVKTVIPIILKADAAGSLEAMEHEVSKRPTEKVDLKIIHKGMGTLSEGDLKAAGDAKEALILGFNVEIDGPAKQLIERDGYTVGTFDIIYKLGEWLEERILERTPKERVEEVSGSAKVLKVFNTEKDRQIIGGKVQDGEIKVGNEFNVLRREAIIGKGKIRELQKFKEKTASVPKDTEFGAFVNASIEIMPGDRIEAFSIVEK